MTKKKTTSKERKKPKERWPLHRPDIFMGLCWPWIMSCPHTHTHTGTPQKPLNAALWHWDPLASRPCLQTPLKQTVGEGEQAVQPVNFYQT